MILHHGVVQLAALVCVQLEYWKVHHNLPSLHTLVSETHSLVYDTDEFWKATALAPCAIVVHQGVVQLLGVPLTHDLHNFTPFPTGCMLQYWQEITTLFTLPSTSPSQELSIQTIFL